MSSNVTNIVVAGLGGQGVLKSSDILADAAFRAGCDVKKSEIHGMSQRGGSVTSDVRFGSEVLSPMVPPGEADFLVVLSADQVEVTRWMLRPDGVLLEPGRISSSLLPSSKCLNVALLGLLSRYLDFSERHWLDALRAALPPKLHEPNLQAFSIGRRSADAVSAEIRKISGKALAG